MSLNFQHQPVLLAEALNLLNVRPNNWYLDATLGDGGHTLALLKLRAKLIAIDQDPDALVRAKARLQSTLTSLTLATEIDLRPDFDCLLLQRNFTSLSQVIAQYHPAGLNGILFDLGVSTNQLLSPQRGFTFLQTAPLDMRLDPSSQGTTAADLVNALSSSELTLMFRRLGNEAYASPIAKKIVNTRQKTPFTTTTQLAQLVSSIKPRRSHLHPATKVFQALRMAVNLERENLTSTLPQAFSSLLPHGRLVIISFHQGEDKIVKDYFRQLHRAGHATVLTPKPLVPSQLEITTNPRSRSAKLRALEKK